VLEELYASIEARQKERASAIRAQAQAGTIEDRVKQARCAYHTTAGAHGPC
jgi:hypothetical protein